MTLTTTALNWRWISYWT